MLSFKVTQTYCIFGDFAVLVSACILLSAQGWLRSRPSHESEILWSLFDKTFESVLTFVRVNLDAKMEILECNFIKQVRCAIQCMYDNMHTRCVADKQKPITIN